MLHCVLIYSHSYFKNTHFRPIKERVAKLVSNHLMKILVPNTMGYRKSFFMGEGEKQN